jgi:hypothetical protein
MLPEIYTFLLQAASPDNAALQTAMNTDLLATIQVSFNNFLQSGQAGAMMIGLVLGYMIKGITK